MNSEIHSLKTSPRHRVREDARSGVGLVVVVITLAVLTSVGALVYKLIQNNSTFNAGGNPSDVKFYSSNKSPIELSGDKIDIHDNVEIRGTIYAPWSEIEVYNSAPNQTVIFGWLWGGKTYVHDGSKVAFPSSGGGGAGVAVNLISWGQLR